VAVHVRGPRLDGSRLAVLLFPTLAASGVLFAQLAEGVAGSGAVVHVDNTIAVWLHAHATGFATGVLSEVTRLGGADFLLGVTFVAVVALLLRRRIAHAALMAAALAGGELLNWMLKAAFERPRPEFTEPLANAAGFSFPSGHAMVSLTVYGALAFVIASRVESRRTRLLIVGSALALVLAIGFSRAYLGVHYVSDVLAGYSAGLAWLVICALGLLVAAWLRDRRDRSLEVSFLPSCGRAGAQREGAGTAPGQRLCVYRFAGPSSAAHP
jgi:membrane-associated phospholipid phosphatase